jgi:hypothetical protein
MFFDDMSNEVNDDWKKELITFKIIILWQHFVLQLLKSF